MSKNLEHFLATKAALLTRYVEKDSLTIIGVEAKEHFKEGFLKGGFTDRVLEPWEEVKRRKADRMKRNKNGSVSKRQGRDQIRPKLVDQGHMRDSIDYQITPGQKVEVGTDDEKGKVQAHNEGTTTAGRNNGVTIPKRQFIGQSDALDQKIETRFETDITNILNE